MTRAKPIAADNHRRQTNWPARLNAFIEQRRAMPFAWGKQDCCLFVADWISLCVGVDPAQAFRGKYADALGAARVLKGRGGLEAMANRELKRFGWGAVKLPCAHRGDVVSVKTEHGPALGICLGVDAVFPGPHGLTFRPMAQCRKAWRVG